ncbi:MAG: ABC-type transporter ATP-binding protein EcsA [Saprospiraceae bacterium]|jgi:Cu-processing system ATP-binding protein|nr:ABC-type transporter ATP-binding protein EcsA [Saprospiraceae bacterium]
MIETRALTKSFKRIRALQQVDLSMNENQVVSLIGPNGSGKTTLIKCILGLVRPDGGEIHINGRAIGEDFQYRSAIGYMPQIGRYPDHMKVGQLFDLLRSLRAKQGGQTDDELIAHYRLERIFDQPMRTLSGGTRQKVSAAVAFLFDPKIYILDEPTAGLDPLSSEILKEKIRKIREHQRLVVITSHILSDLDDLTTHILYLQDGRVHYQASMEELRSFTGEQKFGKAIASIMQQSNR